MRKHITWRPMVGVLVAGVAVAGCGKEKIGGSGARGAANTQTGCLQQAGFKLDPRDADLLEVSRPGSDALANIQTFATVVNAKGLSEEAAPSGKATLIGRQVVLYSGEDFATLKDGVEGCLRRYGPPKKGEA